MFFNSGVLLLLFQALVGSAGVPTVGNALLQFAEVGSSKLQWCSCL